MPITAQLDQGTPGSPLPLEGDDESKSAGFIATANNALTTSLGITAIQRGVGALVGPQVSQADAQAKMKAQGYDASSIPADGVTQGTLNVMMKRQSDIAVNNSVASRANLSGASRFAASIVGSLPDPVNLAFGLAGKVVAPLVSGGIAVRAVGGAAEGAVAAGAQTYGAQAVGHGLGDQDQSSMDNLRTVLFGSILGGGLHVGFGGKTPAVKETPGVEEARDQIITQVAKAEDTTGTGVVTNDTGGLTKFGISQKAHPDIDIANLTPDKAAAIFKSEYWDKINGDALPANVQHTAMDAAVNQGVDNANKWLKESDGDPEKFNQLRADDYNRLAKEDPAKYGKYLNGWLKRLENVANEPVLAQGSAPRIASTDTMGANVDQLPADTRNAALETAVNQFKVDDDVNVEQVINKSLEEHYGVKPDTDFDPTGGIADRDFRTTPGAIASDHAAEVSSLEAEAYSRADPRRLQGADTDMTKAIPQPGRGLVNSGDLDRIEAVKSSVAENKPIIAANAAESPIVAEAKSSMQDAVKEAEALRENIGGAPRKIGPKEIGFEKNDKGFMEGDLKAAGETLRQHADAALRAGYKVTLHTEGKEIPIVGEGMKDANGNKWGAISLLQSMKDGKPDLSAHLAIENPEADEFAKEMADHDEAIAAHNEFAKGVEAAVRCASSMGVE